MKISQVFKDFKGRKGRQVERRGDEVGEGAKWVTFLISLATCRYPGIKGLYPEPPEKGRLEFSPARNQTRPEPEF